jgi:uncharacterized membrane protein
MLLLLAGLALFLGAHSARIVAPEWRARQIARFGTTGWKVAYTLLSAAGLALIVLGYAAARTQPMDLWPTPGWTRHATALLTLVAFVLLAAAYVPGTWIKSQVGHPMLLGTKIWATAHLLSNGRLADLLLFGGFLAWAVACYASSRRRDRNAGVVHRAQGALRDGAAIVVGVGLWAAFALWLHAPLIGVRPLG